MTSTKPNMRTGVNRSDEIKDLCVSAWMFGGSVDLAILSDPLALT